MMIDYLTCMFAERPRCASGACSIRAFQGDVLRYSGTVCPFPTGQFCCEDLVVFVVGEMNAISMAYVDCIVMHNSRGAINAI